MDRDDIRKLTDKDPYLASKLFCRGWIITDDESVDATLYPFYGKWNKISFGKYTILSHALISVYTTEAGDGILGLFGNALDPIDEISDEREILSQMAEFGVDSDAFLKKLNQLTGFFSVFYLDARELRLLSDPVSLGVIFYSVGQKHFYASSHSNLIGDILKVEEDPFVTKLKSQKTFYYFGNQLPGNITRFKEVRQLVANHYLRVNADGEKQIRFYYPHYFDLSIDEIVDRLITILKSTMRLIPEKWERPAISLTGGCDSKTTLAAACDVYDRYRYYSYDSQPNEYPDAEAAKAICESLGLEHIYYHIPYEDSAFENIESIRSIMMWNGGNVRYNNPNDVRKRIYLDKKDDYDVEVKSWASEVGRARYSKRYGDISFGDRPTPRKCTTFYKFLLNRKVINEVDKVFENYLKNYFAQSDDHPIPWQDQFYWEWLWPTRDGLTLTSEFAFSDEVFVPYNNRRVLELLLSVPHKDRYMDTVYTLIRQKLDPRIDKATESIVDVNHTKKRLYLERLYYRVNNLLPY